jgi:galactokinase
MKAQPVDAGLLEEASGLINILTGRGLSPGAAGEKAALFRRCLEKWRSAGLGSGKVLALYVPGRVELLGKHTDYAGGRSLLLAAERGFCLVARARADASLRIVPADGGEATEFNISPELAPMTGHWSNYPMTVARRVARNFTPPLLGADIVFASDLPQAAGMSSSSAMIVAFFLILSAVNDLPAREEYWRNIAASVDLAGYLGTVENGQDFGSLVGDRGVGTFGGSEDHAAILCCRPRQVSQYSFCPIRFERSIAMPEGYILAIGASGVTAEKTGAAMEKYNRASALAAVAVAVWNRATGRGDPHLAFALASAPDAQGRLMAAVQEGGGGFAGRELAARCEQFIDESDWLIPTAGDALDRGNMDELTRCALRSHHMADELLGNQIDETNFLVQSAADRGAAASAFGAGFGGAVWAMVKAGEVNSFIARWSQAYRRKFPRRQGNFFTTLAGPSAFFL